ncbi:Uma2 family endonuclease [Crocosphaera watsonii]|uniref:Gll4219 protein n=1 Tax=Crocosphaera watsonii WH 8502 TaxID=423474 RepID=T2IH54_CROWT|nr:Uma2 family endonuclease [Crocosphaera watsonii]CCQ52234.1 Gll4219 protein [Crocosphaera watsonii WH 8502]
MTSALLNDYFPLQVENGYQEEKFFTSGVNWPAYESFLTFLGNSSPYRVAYLLETLEIMSPSRNHELDKKAIARLLEVYLEEKRIRFWGLGSTTLKNKDKQAGKEPDECYCIGTDKDIPDLAIEVIYTSGGIDTLEIYRRLGVTEVWFWQNQQFTIYCLENDTYQTKPNSQVLPNLDLTFMSQYVTINDPLEAITQWREQIKSYTTF